MMLRASLRLASALSLLLALSAAAVPIHVTHLWHMHQPIYYPYENAVTADSNGRMPYSILGSVFDGDRRSAYQDWPPAAVGYADDREMAHAGSQVSYSGSLAENANAIGLNAGNYANARNNKRTSLNNPRLDMVGIAYHHSLMPLTCPESMAMQIRLHKEQYKDQWGTTDYSKGFWPPECAFDQTMIPALVDEGLEWVIVDNGHLFRTVTDFPWSSASSCKPNAADMVNGSSESLNSQWVQLPNVWAPTKVLAPWSYQPHYVQHVNPETGEIKKIIAVPAGRYEGNENGRGGYGAFKPENVWGGSISANTDSNKPMLLLLHSDGDNYGMKNADAWNGQQENFLNMVQSNPDFEYTSVQDYLSLYPPSESDVIHVEPGSWIGIDGGTPYYEKWLSSTYENGTNPDRWSWSVLVAAQNRVILADTLENTYSMNDVEWGIGSDTAKAWHFYLNAETSCYWYWDHSGEPWDGYVTRASNLAIAEAMKVINRHPGGDTKGPSIFPPQRNYYNPGSYMWEENDPDPSDFTVWSYVDDVSGLESVTLKWRTDKDGYNPLSSTQNETYAGGDEVNAWNSVPMTGSWDPAQKVSVCPDPVARAQMFSADITGQNNVLIDYYIEAVDSNNNTSKSEIIHVVVGDVGPAPEPGLTISSVTSWPGPRHADNPALNPGEDLWIDALTANGTPTQILVHASVDGGAWAQSAMEANGDNAWHVSLGSFSEDECIEFYVTASDAETAVTNNNGGANYTICCVSSNAPVFVNGVALVPALPAAGESVEILYDPGNRILSGVGSVNVHHGYNGSNWTEAPGVAMSQTGSWWKLTFTIPSAATNISMCFNDGTTWDNNGGQDWTFSVIPAAPEPPVPDGLAITNPAAATVTVANAVTEYNLQGTAGTNLTGTLSWSNTLGGTSGTFAHAPRWVLPASLSVGDNVISLSGQIAGTGSSIVTTVAVDSASAYADWTDGSNEGAGFATWTLYSSGSAGHFLDTAGWGMWSHDGDNLAESIRPFAAPLAVGDTVHVSMKNGWVWEEGGGIGIALRNDAGATLWQLYFNGGDTFYNTPLGPSGISWTTNALAVDFTLTAADAYAVAVTPDGGTLWQAAGTVTGIVSQFRAWSYDNGADDGQNHNRNFFVDDLKITRTASGGGEEYSTAVVHIIREAGGQEPMIQHIALDNLSGDLQVNLENTVNGATYAIWASPTLIPTQNWQIVEGTDLPGTGGPLQLDCPPPAENTLYYRVGYTP